MEMIGQDATLHSLRHTHASHLIASGVDVLAISRQNGAQLARNNIEGLRAFILRRSGSRAANYGAGIFGEAE